jgi:hypothetical protein
MEARRSAGDKMRHLEVRHRNFHEYSDEFIIQRLGVNIPIPDVKPCFLSFTRISMPGLILLLSVKRYVIYLRFRLQL